MIGNLPSKGATLGSLFFTCLPTCKYLTHTDHMCNYHVLSYSQGFLGGSSDKESTCQCRRHKRCGFDPWIGKIPWKRVWQPIPVFLPVKSHGHRSGAGHSPWRHKESDVTERLRTRVVPIGICFLSEREPE